MDSSEIITFSDDFDSACSTPFVSAPSSPGRTTSHHPTGFFYSAPASPIHYMISSSSSKPKKGSVTSPEQPPGPFQFETETQTFTSGSTMTSADELFFNGQIRPMKLSSHLQRPQVLSPLLDIHNENENENEDDDDDDVTEEPVRGRDYRSKSLRRRARSMSPLRTNNAAFEWLEEEFEQEGTRQQLEAPEDKINNNNDNNTSNKTKLSEMETTPSGASSRSSSVGRSSKRWVFLKEFLYRSKSEGRTSTSTSTSSSHGSNNNTTNNIKFWTSLSFSPNKEKKIGEEGKGKGKVSGDGNGNVGAKKAVNGVSNRRLGRSARSAHEVHYTLNRAQSEEMRRKTYLPYKQGLLGCLGFSSKSYGAMNGFARALNPVSSR